MPRRECQKLLTLETAGDGVSDLEEFSYEAFDDAAELIGTVSFSVSGLAGTFAGVFDRAAKNQKGGDGGLMPEWDATLVAEIDQFPSEPPVGRNLAIGSSLYRIMRLEADAIAYTLYLSNRVK